MKQGESGAGFIFTLKNTDMTSHTYTYSVNAVSVEKGCKLTLDQADNFISLGQTGTDLVVGSGQTMPNQFIKFNIPKTAPLCQIRYRISLTEDGVGISGATQDLTIK